MPMEGREIGYETSMKGKTSMHRNAENVFTKLQRIRKLAEADMKLKFTSLAHLLTPELLQEELAMLNKRGAAPIIILEHL